jgi:hypothetical protein
MSATILSFRQRQPKRAKRPADPYDAVFLDICDEIARRRERLRDPTPLPGEPGFAPARPLPGKGSLVRMVKKRAQVRREAREAQSKP